VGAPSASPFADHLGQVPHPSDLHFCLGAPFFARAVRAKGGRLQYSAPKFFTYDAENRMISVDSGATTYTYDAFFRRVWK
jgi:hypothetical protein